MDSVDKLIGGLSGAALGAYLFAVVWNGNTKALGALLKDEEGYIEFLVALLLLGMVNKYGPAGKLTHTITTFVIIGVLIRLGAKTHINESLANFAVGKASALETLKTLFQGS